jgi:Uma2 family endonuclease
MAERARVLPSVAEVIARIRAGEAIELVAGEIVPREMSRPSHGHVQTKCGALLDPWNRRGGGGGPGGWWILTEVEVSYPDTDEVFRHDLVGFRRERAPARPDAFPIETRPDWACEILSRSTARHDHVSKKRTLHRHGVPHYWLIDPDGETLLVYRHGPDGYIDVLSAAAGDRVRAEPFDAIEIDVSALLGLDRDEP